MTPDQLGECVEILAILGLIVLVEKIAVLKESPLNDHLRGVDQRPDELRAEAPLSRSCHLTVIIVHTPPNHIAEDIVREILVIQALRNDGIGLKPIRTDQLGHATPILLVSASLAALTLGYILNDCPVFHPTGPNGQLPTAPPATPQTRTMTWPSHLTQVLRYQDRPGSARRDARHWMRMTRPRKRADHLETLSQVSQLDRAARTSGVSGQLSGLLSVVVGVLC